MNIRCQHKKIKEVEKSTSLYRNIFIILIYRKLYAILLIII